MSRPSYAMTKKRVEKNMKILSGPTNEEDKKIQLEGCIQGMTELGAEYVSHGKYNIYFRLKEGNQLDTYIRKNRAKHTAFALTGLLLKWTE